MKQIFLTSIVAFTLFSCQQEGKNTMYIQGNVEGLKRGVIYLQRFDNEGNIKNIDSVVAQGKGTFSFQVPLESPEVFALHLKKEDTKNDFNRLVFFGEPKTITIDTHNETFDLTARILGSETQKLFEEYNQTIRKFNFRNTEFLGQQLQAIKDQKMTLADSIAELSRKNRIRQHLFSVNYALSNKNSYIAPYIALSESYNISPKYLDSIYKSLSKEVSESKYGKLLKTHLDSLQTK